MKAKNLIKPAILVAFILAAIIIGKFTPAADYLTKEAIESFITSLGLYAPLGYIIIYILGTIFFLPGTPITILGGLLFGSIPGTIYTVIGASIGSMIAFVIARKLGREFIDKILKGKFKKLEEYDKKLEENGFLTIIFFRLIPLFPFNGLNFALGITKVKFRDFALATALGIIPGSFILVNIGANATDLGGPKFYVFIAMFIILAGLPTIYKKIKKKHKK